MKEEWLFPEAVVPVDAETTAALVAEIHRLIDVVGGMALAQPERPWVRLTEVDMLDASRHWRHAEDFMAGVYWAAGTLKEKNT
jgi:hypothetical protein